MSTYAAQPNLTKILVTLGPASADEQTILRLIEEGARVFRINFSHGTFDQFENLVMLVRQAERAMGEKGMPIGILGDLCGPKIRLGDVVTGGIDLKTGDVVKIQRQPRTAARDTKGGPVIASTTLPALVDDVGEGERLLVNDGAVRMLVVETPGHGSDRHLVCRVTTGGPINSAKGINLPDTELRVEAITERDWACLDWAVDHDIDFLAISFVQHPDDILRLKKAMTHKARSIPVVAKIEKPQALEHLEAIVSAADGVMVARGDLGVEMDLARVPVIQKQIVQIGHRYGKPVVVATQMLQSMIELPSPTRAEVSDVANAIFDGADALMLSGETAIGRHPVQAVHMMARTVRHAENYLAKTGSIPEEPRIDPRPVASRYRPAALAKGVRAVVQDLGAKLVVTWSQRGGGAHYLSQVRLQVPILAASSNEAALRQMSLLYSVQCVKLERPSTALDFVSAIEPLIIDRGLLELGDPYVLVTGEPVGTPGVTNRLSIRYLGDVCRLDLQ